MQVAVRIGTGNLILDVNKLRYGRFADSDVTQLTTVLSGEVEELYMVFLCRGMWGRTDRYTVMSFTQRGDDWYVLLLRSIDGIGLEFQHGLVAAYGSNARVNDAQNDVSTNGAAIE